MQTEIEVKFLDVTPSLLRTKLTDTGATLVAPERLMRRRNFDFPDGRLANGKSAWVRVRDESGKTTLSYKQTNDYTASGTQEVNLIVDSFDSATEFLLALGMGEKSYQETKRESWKLEEVEIEIDTWPWIPPFVELEGPSEASLREAAGRLGLDWHLHKAGDVTAVYKMHFHATGDEIVHTRITFDGDPAWPIRKTNEQSPS